MGNSVENFVKAMFAPRRRKREIPPWEAIEGEKEFMGCVAIVLPILEFFVSMYFLSIATSDVAIQTFFSGGISAVSFFGFRHLKSLKDLEIEKRYGDKNGFDID